MPDASRLAARFFGNRTKGQPYTSFRFTAAETASIQGAVLADREEAFFSAAISLSRALGEIKGLGSSWTIVQLYYSAYYSIRGLLFSSLAVPFHGSSYYLADLRNTTVLNGGRSSHDFNWASIRSVAGSDLWWTSVDSEEAYKKLKELRERASYSHSFPDPRLPECLANVPNKLEKAYSDYLADNEFFFTYLEDHLPLAYPVQLLNELSISLSGSECLLEDERVDHLRRSWPLTGRPPLF